MKKILAFVLAGTMLLSLSACGPKGTTFSIECETWEGDDKAVAVEFTYPDEASIVEEESAFCDKMLVDKEENYELSFSITEDTTFPANKEYNSSKENYTEFKIGDHDAYAFSDFYQYHIYVLLENVSETTDRYAYIDIAEAEPSFEDGIELKLYNEKEEIQKIVNSLVYKGVIDVTPAPEASEAAN